MVTKLFILFLTEDSGCVDEEFAVFHEPHEFIIGMSGIFYEARK